MKKSIVLLLLLLSGFAFCQLQKKDFVGTDWTINIPNADLTVKDTLTLVRFISYKSNSKLSEEHVMMYYFHENIREKQMTILRFRENNELHVDKTSTIFCGMSPIEDWKWSLDESSKEMTLSLIGEKDFKFSLSEKTSKKETWKRIIYKDREVDFEADIETLKLIKIR